MKVTRVNYINMAGHVDYWECGMHNVVEIQEHLPRGDGDRLWYDIVFNDGHIIRVFNPSYVTLYPED